jgi:hypothetical protein
LDEGNHGVALLSNCEGFLDGLFRFFSGGLAENFDSLGSFHGDFFLIQPTPDHGGVSGEVS